MSGAGGDVSPAILRVKEEQELDVIKVQSQSIYCKVEIEIECATSEAAASLYAEHEVKRELGPERLQPAPHVPTPAAVRVKQEQEWDAAGECGDSETAAADLYAGHEVKTDLVLGPERLQPQDFDFRIQQSLHGAESCRVKQEPAPASGAEAARPGDAPRSGKSCGEQVALRTCSVRLERILVDKELHKCTICHKTFLQECSLKTHLRIHSAEETSSNIIESQRVFSVSKREQSYYCESCGKGFTLNTNLTRHIQIYTSKTPFLCGFCKKQPSYSTFANVKTIHTGEKHYSCKLCFKQFSRSSYLAIHERIHTREKPFTCNICNKQFIVKSALISHERMHTGEKPYLCVICKKQFSHSSSLTNHKRIHTKETPFLCNICNKRFSRNSTLIMHKRIHTGEKPFSCNICDKQFTHSCDLARHKRIHTREKPFLCSICNKQFSLKSTLVRHNRVHTGEKPFSCNICKKEFKQRAHLVRHVLIHTGGSKT